MTGLDNSINNKPINTTNTIDSDHLSPLTSHKENKTFTNISSGLKELEKTTHSPTSSAEKFINSIKHLMVRISFIFKSQGFEANRALDSYRTQEHLINGVGSYRRGHEKAFMEAFKGNGSQNFDKLRTEYSQMNGMSIAEMNLGVHKPWVKDTKKKLENLKDGESLWINWDSELAQHAMMMRIEKKSEGSYNLYFANSGGGIEDNSDFHPSKINEDGSKSYQLVAVIGNIPAENLLKGDFLKNFANAFCTGKNSQAASALEKNEESLYPHIDALYRELKVLSQQGPATLNPMSDERTVGRKQITGSCAASCVLAMARTYLTPEEFRGMEVDMQVKSLVKHYKQIESGKDTSSTRKIMVLDLIQSLKKDFSGENLRLIEGIETKVKDSLNMHNAELKISTSSRVNLDKFITEEKGESFKLAPFKPKISKGVNSTQVQQSTLKANVKMNKDPAANFDYEVKKNEKGQWEGVDLNDKIALVCFHIANGDHNQTDISMKDLISELQKPSPAQTKLSKEEQYKKQCYTGELLSNLSAEFRQVDNSRSGIAKQLFLSSLALEEFCKRNDLDFKEINKDLWKIDINDKNSQKKTDEKVTDLIISNIQKTSPGSDEEAQFNLRISGYGIARGAFCFSKALYADLNVEHHLNSDNIWIQGLDCIKGRQPSSSPEALSHEHEPKNYHISELLDSASDTEGSANQVALHFFHEQKV